jgi:hypothetical protein
MTWALMGGKALEFLKNIPTWVYIALAFLVTLQIVDMRAEGRGRKKMQAKQRETSLKEAAVIEGTRRTIQEDRTNDIQAAEQAARDLPTYSSVDELRDGNSAVYSELFGDTRGRDGEAKTR